MRVRVYLCASMCVHVCLRVWLSDRDHGCIFLIYPRVCVCVCAYLCAYIVCLCVSMCVYVFVYQLVATAGFFQYTNDEMSFAVSSCNVLQCVAVCCRYLLQLLCVAECCITVVLDKDLFSCATWGGAVVCCSVLQVIFAVAVCCSVLQDRSTRQVTVFTCYARGYISVLQCVAGDCCSCSVLQAFIHFSCKPEVFWISDVNLGISWVLKQTWGFSYFSHELERFSISHVNLSVFLFLTETCQSL